MNRRLFLLSGLTAAVSGCKRSDADAGYAIFSMSAETAPHANRTDAQRASIPQHLKLARAAEARTRMDVTYDPSYIAIDYPGGDIPVDRGVCADVVIRAYRAIGVDLQVDLHEDMAANFAAYPNEWGLSRPDANIDHRRVLNLETYFTRQGDKLPASTSPSDIQPGDLVTWRIGGRLPHIGVASRQRNSAGEPLFVHNVGAGPQLETCFDTWPRIAVYRHRPWNKTQEAVSAP